MTRVDLERWLPTFVQDLTPGGVAVPLRRAMKRHRETFAALRAMGLTWKGIAQCLNQAGQGTPGFTPVSPTLLRGNFARLAPMPGDEPAAPPQDRPPSSRSSKVTLTAKFSPQNKLGTVVAFKRQRNGA